MRNRTNDPRHLSYWISRGYTEDEANEKIKYERRRRSCRCVEYWLYKGYSLEEAQEQVRLTQSKCAEQQIGRIVTDETKNKIRESNKKFNTLDRWIEVYGEELGKIKYEEYKKKQRKKCSQGFKTRLEKNPNTYIENSHRRPEYWIKRGYSPEEAELMVGKSQSRGLDFYTNKYGLEEGTKKWEERNRKWLETFMRNNDLIEVNRKRKLNSHVGYYTKETIKNIKKINFYLLTLLDSDGTLICKYGLTKHKSISKRWSPSIPYNLMLFCEMDSSDAVELETSLNDLFRRSYKPSIIDTTECFVLTEENKKTLLGKLGEFNVVIPNTTNE